MEFDIRLRMCTHGKAPSFRGHTRWVFEIPCQPPGDAFVLAPGALHVVRRTTLDTRRINTHAEFGQESVRHESAPRNRIKMQRLLVNLDLFFELDLRYRDEGLLRVTDTLGFNSHGCVPGHRVGETLFTTLAVQRRLLTCATHRVESNPHIQRAAVDPVRH